MKESIGDYIFLGDDSIRSRCLVGQTQYLAQYIGKSRFWFSGGDDLAFGLDLRFKNLDDSCGDYHSFMIHSDDAEAFVRRVNSYVARRQYTPQEIKELESKGYIFEEG